MLFLILFLTAESSKDTLKTWQDSNFYVRNRLLAKNNARIKDTGLRFEMGFEIVKDTIEIVPGGIIFEIKSIYEQTPYLKAEIVMYTSGALHSYIDEIEPIYKRYRSPNDDILNKDKLYKVNQDSVKVNKEKVVFEFEKISYEINFSNMLIQGFYDGVPTIQVNSQSMMNFDRYRTKKTDIKPACQVKDSTQPIQILDSAGVYIERNKQLVYFDELWAESFQGFTDIKKKGPSSVALDFTFIHATDVYGIPEHADHISLKDTVDDIPYRLYNVDYSEHELDDRMSLYGSVPFMISRHNAEMSAGVFWLNPSESYVDISTTADGKLTHWISESGVLEFFMFLDSSPIKIIESYTMLTGPPQLPPLFALGYHQSRWNYMSQDDLLQVSSGFELHDLPLDVL